MCNLLLLGIGGQELIFIALIILLLFGGKKIPELMKGLGKGVKSFKDGWPEKAIAPHASRNIWLQSKKRIKRHAPMGRLKWSCRMNCYGIT